MIIINRVTNLIAITLIIVLSYLIARSSVFYKKDHEKASRKFWERESEANTVRKKDISSLPYIHVPLDKLPIAALTMIDEAKLAEDITKLAEKKLLNLAQYTNTDLKIMYGPANLEILSICDNDYTSLIRLLDKSARCLIENDMKEEAKSFLSFGIDIGSDISTTYAMLGKIYAEAGDKKAFNELVNKASKLNGLSKNSILTKLDDIKSSIL